MLDEKSVELRALTAEVVAAYLSNNPVPTEAVGGIINTVFSALTSVGSEPTSEGDAASVTPAVPIKKSITPSAIICLECGKPMKMLKRHLTTEHGLSVSDYRSKWKLASDYPVVAPDYAAARSEMAKKIGLGNKPKKRSRKKSTAV